MRPFDIAYIVVHGFSARMIMQTDLLGSLIKEGKKIALIAPDKRDENLKSYCNKAGVELFEFNPDSSFWNDHYHNARKYFLEDIKANPALWEKHLHETKFNTAKNPWRHIRPRLLMLCYYLCKMMPGLRTWYKKREEKYLESIEAQSLLDLINPELIVSTYPVNFSEAMLLKAAKLKGVKTVIHLLSWDNISCKGHFPQLADEYIAWGPIMQKELKDYYNIPDEKIHVYGVPHFDLHLESRGKPQPDIHLEKLGLEANKPYLFFGMSSPRFAPKEIDIVEWLALEIGKDTFGKGMQLVVRPHPQNVQGSMADSSWLPRLKAIQNERVVIDYPKLVKSKMPWSMQEYDMIRLSHLLAGCSVSLNSGSTLSIDALMCGVPVIITSFDGDNQLPYWQSSKRLIDYNHLNKFTSLGGASVVYSFHDMTTILKNYIQNPDYNIKNRQLTIEQECANFAYPATEKIGLVFLSLLETQDVTNEQY
jgi:glycosyltransferase involved in cell wall biosynthesis